MSYICIVFIAIALQMRVYHSVELSEHVKVEFIILNLKMAVSVLEKEERSIAINAVPRILFDHDLLIEEKFAISNDDKIMDVWGREVVFVKGEKSIEIYSLGRDGISKSMGNDADDINSWDKSKSWRKTYKHLSRKPSLLEAVIKFIKEIFVKNVY